MKKILLLLLINVFILSGCSKSTNQEPIEPQTTSSDLNQESQVNLEQHDNTTKMEVAETVKLESNSIASEISNRDAKRLADIKQIMAALELFQYDNKIFPHTLTPGQSLASLSDPTYLYMAKIPSNQKPWTDNGCPDQDFKYQVIGGGGDYSLVFCLGTDIGGYTKGVNIATRQGIGAPEQYEQLEKSLNSSRVIPEIKNELPILNK